MAQINPYLIFNGNCEEAFTFYHSVFGGELAIMGRFKDMPPSDGTTLADSDLNRIMHVTLPISNETVLMGSDSNSQSGDVKFGGNVFISINTSSEEEAQKIFDGLASGGKVTMPLAKTFWNAFFGMCSDKFGINWMVNYDYK